MSGRSSRPDRGSRAARVALAASLALAAGAACGKPAGKNKPQADPAEVKKLAAAMARNVPSPASARDCTPDDLAGAPTLTFRSLLQLGDQKLADTPEEAAWINPPELDAPAVRTLLDPKAATTAAREAAAELLGAKHWIAYKVDMVNAPMALGVKELKIGTVGTRVVRYDRSTSIPDCVLVFFFQNDKAVSDDAIEKSDKALIDPEVARVLREDLTAQWIKQAPRGPLPAPAAK